MSVERNGATATPATAKLAPKGGVVRARHVVRLTLDDEVADPLVDAPADKLSNRLAGRVADRLVGRMSELADRGREDRKQLPLPDGAKYATAEQLAARYQLSLQWVESRAANLGATPISDSTNSKLRYHFATADAYMDARVPRYRVRPLRALLQVIRCGRHW